MVKYHTKLLLLAGIILAVMLLAHPVAAQNYWMYPGGGKSISLEVYKPNFDGSENLGFFNSVLFLSGNFQAADKLSVFIEIPISNFDVDNDYPWDEDETLFGNPYIGFEAKTPMSDESQSTVVRIGVRLPFASEEKFNATVIGILTTFNRFEAFIPDLATISLGGGYYHTLEMASITP